MIKYVLLDLDDTILDFHKSEAESLIKALRSLGTEPTAGMLDRYSAINDAQWKRLERGEATRDEILTERFVELFSEFSISAEPKKMREAYESELSRSFFFIDGAIELLEELSKEYDLYLASNGTDSVQTGRIAASGIEKYFKDIFISERLGANKPSIEYFRACEERIENFSREECIIVGDSLSSDILGGIRAGIKTCRFNPKGLPVSEEIKPDYEIRALCELIPLLESI